MSYYVCAECGHLMPSDPKDPCLYCHEHECVEAEHCEYCGEPIDIENEGVYRRLCKDCFEALQSEFNKMINDRYDNYEISIIREMVEDGYVLVKK